MRINQAEQLAGITKKNIRFYEEQGLLHPSRGENGYREYSEADLDTLSKIKLLRKLSVPIDEIRNIQERRLSLPDCMERHMIFLSHEEKNIALVKEICREIQEKESSLSSLSAAVYLEEMTRLEEGGTRFMDIGKRDTKKKKYGPVIASAVMILLMLALLVPVVIAQFLYPMPMILFLLIIFLPLTVIAGVLLALRQRFKEIEGGEEYEASKY